MGSGLRNALLGHSDRYIPLPGAMKALPRPVDGIDAQAPLRRFLSVGAALRTGDVYSSIFIEVYGFNADAVGT